MAAVMMGYGPLGAQGVVVVDAQVSTPRVDPRLLEELLRRTVTLDLTQVTISQAIDAAAASARVPIQNRADMVDTHGGPITLHLTKVSLRVALDRILSGTTLRVVADGSTRLTIVDGGDRGRARMEGGITGTVRDARTKRPLAGATVVLDDSVARSTRPARTVTDQHGHYRLSDVPLGFHQVTVRALGFSRQARPVVVSDSGVAVVDFLMAASSTTLDQVVVTATGDRRRSETGNAIGTIKADSIVPTTLIRNVSDLLQARIPGVVVTNTSGDVGAPSKIRLRGLSSLNLNNDPIVIVDGVRINAQMTAAALQTNTGSVSTLGQLTGPYGQPVPAPLAPSRLDDLDPNTIESIDVLRGPSASSLYGTDAANGVIVIKTKKGQPGSWRATLLEDAGWSSIPGSMPEFWYGWGRQNSGGRTAGCTLSQDFLTVVGGGCIQDSVTHFNPENYGPMRTFGQGTTQTLSGSLSGGTQAVTQFFSARMGSSVGMAKMSDVERRLIAQLWSVPAPSWMIHPNSEQDLDGSSTTTIQIAPAADVSLAMTGIYRDVLNGGNGILTSSLAFGPGDSLSYLPSESQRTRATSNETRGTAAATVHYRPWSWVSLTGTGGGDLGLRTDQSDLQAQNCTAALQLYNGCPSGRRVARGQTFVSNVSGNAHITSTPFSWFTLQTSIGQQYTHTRFYQMQVGNSSPSYCPLAFGTTLLTPAPVCRDYTAQQYAVTESRDESAEVGIYVEETVNLFGMYTTFGIRRDLASGFGGQVTKSPPNYPKFDLSYPLSEKSFFPKQPYVSSLRLRLAYGQSGTQASQTAVRNNYEQGTDTYVGTAVGIPTIDVSQLGNSELRPEKGTEWEGGVDISFFEGERLRVEFTQYRKYTRDMLSTLTLAPSLGYYTQYYNLGNVENRGLEVTVAARIFDSRALSWMVSVAGSKNSNKLVHKSATLDASGPWDTKIREGYPLDGHWGVMTESYWDANHEHILAANESVLSPQRYLGAPSPDGTLTYTNALSLWDGAVQLSANVSQIIRQTTLLSADHLHPRAAVDRTTSLAEQAAYLEAMVNDRFYMGTSSTVRLNELSATYTVPFSITRRFHAKTMTVTLAGRNLAFWSSYAGKDPDVDTSNLFGEASIDLVTGTPQPRSWAFKVNLGL